VTAAVVFDLDGTLADTVADISESLDTALATMGLPGVEPEAIRLMIGHGPAVLAQRALQHHDISTEQHLVTHLTNAFMGHDSASGNRLSSLFPGVRDCLEELASMNVAIGVCSNKPHGASRGLLVDLGIAKYIDALQGAWAGMPKKPDPTMLLEVLRSLGAPAEDALYVGDSDTDVRTARAAGLPVVLVSYGYSDKPAEQLGADQVVSSLRELPATWPGLMTPGPATDPRPRRLTAS
jgi:phosphoglycolate phosphatase